MLFEKIVFSVFYKVCNSSLVEFKYASQVIEKNENQSMVSCWYWEFFMDRANFTLCKGIQAEENRSRFITGILPI